MSRAISPSSARPFSLVRVCRLSGVPRATAQAHRALAQVPAELRPVRRRPGPVGACTDDELALAIRWEIAASPWHGEGYRKIWARLRFRGIRTGRDRVLRIMREQQLLSPQRAPGLVAKWLHDGTITTDTPDEMWGTDMTETITLVDGRAYVFISVDHCTGELIGVHAARNPNRWEALEPVRQGVREKFGRFMPGVATGLSLRHDHGTQYMSHDFQAEIALLGIESSPSFIRQPEGNGIAERFIRTLKENLLWIEHFDTIEDLRLALQRFKNTYNEEWILQRHGYLTPTQKRATLTPPLTLEIAA